MLRLHWPGSCRGGQAVRSAVASRPLHHACLKEPGFTRRSPSYTVQSGRLFSTRHAATTPTQWRRWCQMVGSAVAYRPCHPACNGCRSLASSASLRVLLLPWAAKAVLRYFCVRAEERRRHGTPDPPEHMQTMNRTSRRIRGLFAWSSSELWRCFKYSRSKIKN